MLGSGYIKLSRSITKWGWYKNSATKDLFIHLLITANYEDCEFEGITVHRGQVVISYPSLKESTGLSIQNLRTAMRHLKETGEITTERFSKFNLVTIVNYEKYQGFEDEKSNSQSTFNQQSANSQITINQQSANTNERNKEIKKARKQENIYRALDGKTENLRSAYWAFIEMRKKIKKPMTERALQIIIGKVEKLSSDTETQMAIINQSVEHCWQSVYPLREEGENNANSKQCDNRSEYHNEWNGTVL